MNSIARVEVDGVEAGVLRFPSGAIDLSEMCRPGKKHTLRLKVTALPLKAIMAGFGDTNAPKTVKGTVERRGLCGDVFLTSVPALGRIDDIRIAPSVRKNELTVRVRAEGLNESMYVLRVEIRDKVKTVREFASQSFQPIKDHAGDVTGRREVDAGETVGHPHAGESAVGSRDLGRGVGEGHVSGN